MSMSPHSRREAWKLTPKPQAKTPKAETSQAEKQSFLRKYIDTGGVIGARIDILDSQAEDAFSFLLNSHHKLFGDVRLEPELVGLRAELIRKGTDVIIKALQFQLDVLSTTLPD